MQSSSHKRDNEFYRLASEWLRLGALKPIDEKKYRVDLEKWHDDAIEYLVKINLEAIERGSNSKSASTNPEKSEIWPKKRPAKRVLQNHKLFSPPQRGYRPCAVRNAPNFQTRRSVDDVAARKYSAN